MIDVPSQAQTLQWTLPVVTYRPSLSARRHHWTHTQGAPLLLYPIRNAYYQCGGNFRHHFRWIATPRRASFTGILSLAVSLLQNRELRLAFARMCCSASSTFGPCGVNDYHRLASA